MPYLGSAYSFEMFTMSGIFILLPALVFSFGLLENLGSKRGGFPYSRHFGVFLGQYIGTAFLLVDYISRPLPIFRDLTYP